jgi:hypothetical protein
MSILRRLRGVLGTAATWCVAFTGVGGVITLAALTFLKLSGVAGPIPVMQLVVEGATALIRWGLLGAGSGAAFASVILLAGERRTLTRLSSWRFASWGFLAGAVGSGLVGAGILAMLKLPLPAMGLALPIGLVAGVAVIGGALGSGMATATLRAIRGDPTLAAPAAPGLTSG